MPQTVYDAMKLSRNPYTAQMMKAIATSDEMFSLLPMVHKSGEGFSYSREVSLGSFPFVADGHTSVAESTGTSETITVPKREAVSDFYVRNFAQSNLADSVSPLEMQTLTKFKAAGRALAESAIGGGYITGFTLSNQFVHSTTPGAYVDAVTATSGFMDSNRQGPGSFKYTNTGTLLQFRAPGDRDYGAAVDTSGGDGNYTLTSDNPSMWITVTLDVSDVDTDCEVAVVFTSTTHELDGLSKLISSTQIRSSTGGSGDALSFAIMDELMDSVKVRENLAFVGNAAIVRKAKALLRGAGGLDPVQLMDGTFTVPSYSGIPILKNDWIPSNEVKTVSTLSSLYLVSLSAEEGFFLGSNGDEFTVDSDPRDATVMGFRLFELGQNQAGSSSVGRRLSWFGGAALGSDLAAARAKELITA